MCQCKLSVFSVVLGFCVYFVSTFNVDSFNYAVYETPFPDSHNAMFGFSLALHKERNSGWLIVGAPEAQSNQPGVIHGGAVYKCPTSRDGGCEEIPFDTKGHNRDARGNLMDNKTEQWFGATVSASGKDEGPIVACAPRYTWFPNGRTRRDPVGTCYVCNGFFSDFNEYSPCRTYQWGYHRQGSCQAGFSAAINKVGDRLFIGSPGSWYWQGQMYSVDAHATFDYKPSIFSATYGDEGQVHQQSLETRPAVFHTNESTEKDDDSYMGYSTITGDFWGNGEEGIAVGMPRGNNLRGKVLLFTWNFMNYLDTFTSDQIGSYYGYALAASDVDGDNKLDLIVGAPMYTVPNNNDKYDVGRVYIVYHSSEKGRFKATDFLDGVKSKSRFGQALASLGDINQDGYGDFAVGAPYDGNGNDRGAVYIYHGSSKGVRKKFSQVIFAEDVVPFPAGALNTFGFSITGGLDLDNNLYPDMAVGAYNSSKAFFFRSRPVIKVEASVKFLSKSVDIVNTNYNLRRDGTPATKTQIQFCSKYTGKGIPSSLNLGVEYILDTKKLINPRMGFVDNEDQNRKNATITLLRDQPTKCFPPVDVYVRSDIRDKLTSLVAEAKYWLRDDADLSPTYLQQLPRNPRAQLIPVLDLNSPPSQKDSIYIQKNCGPDNVCIPNLDLVVQPSVESYYLDSGKNFYLDVTVSNSGEDAFEATVDVTYPDGFFYDTSTDVQVVSHVLCSSGENNTIKCDIGNPVPFNKIVHFKLSFQPDYGRELPSVLHFDVSTNSTNEEPIETLGNNKQRVEISILYDVIQELRGWSIPDEVIFTPTSTLYAEDIANQTSRTSSRDRLSEDVIGPQVVHVYELTNRGKTTIKATEIFFVWPATTATGEDFLYLVDPPHFSFTKNLNLKCGPIPANYRDFEVIPRRKTIWELYDINVRTDDGSTAKFISDRNQTRIGSTVGGKRVKGDEALNKEVDKSGDSSQVMDVRRQHHKEEKEDKKQVWQQSTKVQIFEAGDISERPISDNLKYFQIGSRNYLYRCYKNINGREQEVDCGNFAITRNAQNLLQLSNAQFQEEGNMRFWCLNQDSFGNWQKVPCGAVPKLPVTSQKQEDGATTIQIFNGEGDVNRLLESGNYQRQKISGKDFVYRCFRRVNGREQEIPCGRDFSFGTVDIPWVLENSGIQQEGNIRYACLEPDSQGRLQRTNCYNIPKIKVKTEIFRESWGQNNTHYWNNSGVYFTGAKQDFSRVQVFKGNENIRRELEGGIYRHQYIDGNNFIYRCFRNVNGRELEVDCGEDFSLARLNILHLLAQTGVQNDGQIRYSCFEPDDRGGVISIDCTGVPAIRFKTQVIKTFWKQNATHYWNNTGVYNLRVDYGFDAVQVLQGGQEILPSLTGNYRIEYVEGQGFLYRCFRDTQQVDCGSKFSLAGINILVLLRRATISREENIRYCCLQLGGDGSWAPNDCSTLPRIQLAKKQSYSQEILRRCLKLVNHNWQDVDCQSEVRFQGGGSSTFVEECYQTKDGRRERIECDKVPAGAVFTDAYSGTHNQASHGSSYSGQTQTNQQTHGSGFSTGQSYNQPSRTHDYNYGYGRAHNQTQNQNYYENSYEDNYEEEYEDGKAPLYPNPSTTSREQLQGRRDPHTYGTYGGNYHGSESVGIGNAAQGSGFTAGVLDLGTLGSQGNVGESHWSETHQVPLVPNNLGDNVPTSSPSSRTWHHGRKKRQIVGDSHPSIATIKNAYPCKNLGCVYMRCTIENLRHGEPLTIALRGRLNAKVLRDMKLDNAMEFSSMMLTRVHKVPNLMPIEDSKPTKYEVETVVKIPEEIKSESVPLWIVVVSAVAGTVILLFLIYLLYKLGFFKRNRPSSAPERQPLNRNGYHHGDEAL